jgi:pyruvate kinase
VADLGEGNSKAIGVIDPDTVTPEELHDMHRAGIRGIRVNL